MKPEESLPHIHVSAIFLILVKINSVHAPSSHFLNIHLNIILPSMHGSSKWSLILGFLTKTLYTPLLSPIRATCQDRLILLNFIIRNIFGQEYRSLNSSLCDFFHSPLTSPLLGRNILHSTLFSNNLSLRSSLNVSDLVPHPYKTTGKNIFLLNLIFIFLDSKMEDKKICTEW